MHIHASKEWNGTIGQWFISKNRIILEMKLKNPLMLLGFVSIKGEHKAIIQCLLKPLSWDHLQEKFIMEIELGTNFNVSFVTVPVIQPFIHCVFFLMEKNE